MRRLAFLTVLGFAHIAAAQPGLTPPIAPPPEEVTSYRTYTLAVDATSLGLFAAGALAEGPSGADGGPSTALMSLGLLGGMFGTPIVHASRGHWGRAAGSLAMRWLLAGAGIYVAVGSAHCGSEDPQCGADRIGPGMLVGLAVASVIDAGAMTDERRPAPSWTPQVAATRGGVQLGVAARF